MGRGPSIWKGLSLGFRGNTGQTLTMALLCAIINLFLPCVIMAVTLPWMGFEMFDKDDIGCPQ